MECDACAVAVILSVSLCFSSRSKAGASVLILHLVAQHKGGVPTKGVSIDCMGCISDFHADDFAACIGPVSALHDTFV